MPEESLIKKYKLTEEEVEQIVKEWYTNGMFPEVLRDCYGNDLEEILDS